MKQFARDIRFTLMIKCFLLFLLWFICFHSPEKHKYDLISRLTGQASEIQEATQGVQR